jgi:predicted phosphohydrolase
MRIVAVADTHLFHDELVVPDGDVFVHAGDMCRAGDRAELLGAAKWIRALPHRVKIVVAGNHDWYFAEELDAARAVLGGDIVFLHDGGTVIDGVRFWGSPWQPEFNAWAFNLPRGAALAAKWALIPEDTEVLVTHGPPMGIGDRSMTGGRQGCADLLERVRAIAPRVHVFGHIHEDGGSWPQGETLFVNVTTDECERAPTVIDFDPVTKLVTSTVIPPRRGR